MVGKEATHTMLPEPLPPEPHVTPPLAKRHKPSLPPIEAPSRQQLMSTSIPDDLGKLIEDDHKLFLQLGWEQFIRLKRGRGNFTSLQKLRHPAKRIIKHYSTRGVPCIQPLGLIFD